MFEKIKSRLVEDWKKLHKMWSVWLITLTFAVLAIPEVLPSVAMWLPEGVAKWLALAALFARALKQGKEQAEKGDKDDNAPSDS